MHNKRDLQTLQKTHNWTHKKLGNFQQIQHSVIPQPRKCAHVAGSSASSKSAYSPIKPVTYSFPEHLSAVQYKKCAHVKKTQFTSISTGSNLLTGTPPKNKQENAQVIYKRCEHMQNVDEINNTNVKNANTGTPKSSGEANKIVNKNAVGSNLNKKPQKATAPQKGVVPEESKASEANSNKTAARPQTTNNFLQKKNIAAVEQTNQNVRSTVQNAVKSAPTSPKTQPKAQHPRVNSVGSRKDDRITEIYKRPKELEHSEGSLNPEPTSAENLDFQKVTRELANIIKNFQKQIQDVPITKAKAEEVPSAMIQPKVKEFFKNTQKDPAPKNPPAESSKNENLEPSIPEKDQNSKTSTSGKSQNLNSSSSSSKNHSLTKKSSFNKHPIQNKSSRIFGGGIGKQSSWRRLSGSSIASKSGDLRRFHSLTHHNLTVKQSTSNRKMYKRSSSQNIDPLKQLKEEVHRAIRDHKTFTVRGHFAPIRKALLARGWVEKFHASYKDQLSDDLKRYQNYSIAELLPLLRRENLTVTCKNLIKSKLLGGYQVDFYWGTNDEAFKENPDKIKLTLINKLKREIFSYTNKQGLCEASKLSYWYQKNNVSKLNHPRTYSLGKNGDIKGFCEDFYITAAMSLLKWVVKMNMTKECKLMSSSGKIPLEVFDFALNECCKFIKRGRHEDIDVNIPDATESEWNKFLDFFYKLVHYNNHFKAEPTETEDSLVRKSNYILNNIRNFYPYVDMDGIMNIWILKPTASSRGRGIHMCRTIQYVLKTVKANYTVRYIIQKYIERPLLIYNTKFDIRQWFLISNCNPLTIWMYKECYLRFSSQTYNLRKLHESIHLTNNSVQCKYKNTSIDAALPSYNMWDSADFQKYLSNIGYPNAFKNIIYSGMKQCITAAVLMHHDKMVIRKNCFELYGADFILTEDFQPWLLEINSNPALYASTPVTARMCPKVLEDVIKVVIDYAHNCKANTGSFELVYKQQAMKLPLAANLEVRGLPLHNSYFRNAPEEELKESLLQTSYDSSQFVDNSQDCLKNFGEEIKKTLKNLLQIIQSEKQKRGLEHQNQNLTIIA